MGLEDEHVGRQGAEIASGSEVQRPASSLVASATRWRGPGEPGGQSVGRRRLWLAHVGVLVAAFVVSTVLANRDDDEPPAFDSKGRSWARRAAIGWPAVPRPTRCSDSGGRRSPRRRRRSHRRGQPPRRDRRRPWRRPHTSVRRLARHGSLWSRRRRRFRRSGRHGGRLRGAARVLRRQCAEITAPSSCR